MSPGRRPTLVIMAAGMGSRYGGLKQLDPVGPSGELLIHYSLYDAHLAGFDRVVFVIRQDFEEEFKERITPFSPKGVDLVYVYQDVSDLPKGRTKPWGTGHAVLVCDSAIDGPFGVINADDYYGRSAFQTLYDFLKSDRCTERTYCMVGYLLRNTVSPHGAVTRGVCRVADGALTGINETGGIELRGGEIGVEENGIWKVFDPSSPVSMNIWGFDSNLFLYLKDRFASFVTSAEGNPKEEFLIPEVIGDLVREGALRVDVLETDEVWFGMTHPEDRRIVTEKIAQMVKDGIYPQSLG
ncbi:MAG: nucleotidyltransferase [Deltaproteobacteria bacterium]|nr:nucleotidyltransferase [Candidatus Zymogenaceae bacterium]